ncbi:MAG: site-specific integrase [bacterium]|nr:site-specific integrase [bacterium]
MAEVTPRHKRGTVRRRGNRWQVDVVVDGRRVRRSAPTRDAANELLDQLLTRINAQDHGASPIDHGEQAADHTEPTVSLVLERYLASTRLHCRPRTIRTTEAAIQRLDQFFAQALASSLSRTEIDRYAAARLRDGVGPHTPNRELACLRAALVQARDDGLIERAPRIRMLRTVRAVPRVLSKPQIKQLVTDTGEFSVVFALAAGAGLRAAEMRWLTWADVDAPRSSIIIRAKGTWRPKTHAEREVPMSPRLAERLQAHRAARSSSEDWVLAVPRHHGQWSESGLSHAARRHAQEAKVWAPGCKPLHDLRRSWASHLLAAGTPIDTVRRLGGWASNSTLEQFYLAPTTESLDKATRASRDLL